MTTDYPQWKPDDLEPSSGPSIDPLSEQVASGEDLDVLRDPEADAKPEIIRVGNTPPQPVPAFVDHGQHSAATVDRVDATAHLQDRQPSTDRHSDDVLNQLEPIPHHKGIFRRRDDRGREAFSIAYLDAAGNRRVQPIDARDLEAAEDALTDALLMDGREPIK